MLGISIVGWLLRREWKCGAHGNLPSPSNCSFPAAHEVSTKNKGNDTLYCYKQVDPVGGKLLSNLIWESRVCHNLTTSTHQGFMRPDYLAAERLAFLGNRSLYIQEVEEQNKSFCALAPGGRNMHYHLFLCLRKLNFIYIKGCPLKFLWC